MSIDELNVPDDRVPASRRRGGLAATRSGHQQNERSFFCRVCQRVERGLWVPTGWYLLERAPGGRSRHLRLGLYCSVACLVQAGRMLEEGAAIHARCTDLPSEEDRRRERRRVIEISQTLLSGGMSIREAAGSLGIPAFTLRSWLKEAGITVERAAVPQETTRPAAPAGHHPVSVLNEWAQQGRITAPEWEMASSGPPHAPAFTATVSARPAGADLALSASGEGTSKTEARTAAAAALLALIGTG
ncbi:putative dsRNA-binding protein [Planomonospora corallina]|uniref:DsRNA-binding protein n=1 Tax=Planomonospora corallina TaxID=1806052 RepID=A0ABV8IB66_9ACTN